MQNFSKRTEPAEETPGDISPHTSSRRENGITMLFCVLAAICIWFYVMSIDSPTSTETFSSVPVSIINDRDGEQDAALTAISGTNSVVEVTLKGRKTVLNNL